MENEIHLLENEEQPIKDAKSFLAKYGIDKSEAKNIVAFFENLINQEDSRIKAKPTFNGKSKGRTVAMSPSLSEVRFLIDFR